MARHLDRRRFRALLAASGFALLVPSASLARINIDDGPWGPVGGDGPVFEPGDGGGGGGGFSPTPTWLEENGYVCRPYNDGLMIGKRCDGTFIEPTAFTSTLEVYRCNPNGTCSRRATKISRGKVGTNLSLWSFEFPSMAKGPSGFGDVDGDGDDDVVAFWGNGSVAGQVRVGRSNGVNEFSPAPELWASGFCAAPSQECAVGDFNADHRTDVVSFDSATGQVSVATSNGSAFVGPRSWSSTFGALNGRTVVADFDGDGADDVAKVLNANSTAGVRGSVIVALSRPGPSLATPGVAVVTASASTAEAGTFTAVAPSRTTLAIDLSGDLVAETIDTAPADFNFPGGPVIGGPPVFSTPVLWTSGLCPDPHECVAGDFDGDGKDDMALVRATGESYVALSTGSAFGDAENWSDRVGRNPRSFRAADLNRDGKDDLVAIQIDGSLTVGVSSGAFFVANVDVEAMNCGDPLYGCQFANLDGDAHPELVEIYPYGNSQLRPGDTFVSKGVEPRGFPVEPAHATPPDGDGDGVRDAADACIYVANASQQDSDGDGLGDACELRADLNQDGIVNQLDRDLVLAHMGESFAAADVNKDGIVDATDLSILNFEAYAPAPSATVGEPVVELVSPRNGTFYEAWTRKVWVSGFVRNAAAQNGTLVVKSQAWQGAPVETPLAIGPDGWFGAFVPIDPQADLNPIAAVVTRTNGGRKGTGRAVAQIGRSAAPGDYSPSSLGARIQAWQLSELAELARKEINLTEVANEAEGGSVKNMTITGPLSLTVRPFSDRIAVDIGIPAVSVFYEEFLSGCNVPISIGGLSAHLDLNLEPRYMYPNQVAATDLEGSPNVTFASFHTGEHAGCSLLGDVTGADMRASAEQAFELALMARDFGAGPVDGGIESRINAIDLSQALTDLDVVLGTRFRSVPEDVAGVTLDLDSGFAAESLCGTALCHPPLTNEATRAFQTGAAHPPFPLWMPDGRLYDIALALAPDTINQLFAAMMAGGKLEALLGGRTIPLTEDAALLALAGLDAKLRLMPTVAPFLTGRPREEGGGTEVKVGQLLLEIPTLVGGDAIRFAADLRGFASFAIVEDLPNLPVVGAETVMVLQVRIHNLELLDADIVHLPTGMPQELGDFVLSQLAAKVGEQSLSVEYPLPKFDDLGLELLGLDARPDGGAIVFANLDLAADPDNGPVLSDGFLTQP